MPEASTGPVPLRLWLANLTAAQVDLQRYAEFLGLEERQRADRFHFDRDRIAFILRRGILRELLSERLGLSPGSIGFQPGLHGKPELQPRSSLRFNTSRSGSLVLVGFAEGCELGVDIEEIRPLLQFESLHPTILAPSEQEEFASIPTALQQDVFYQFWTRKEAVLKAYGIGLGMEPRDLTVGLAARGHPSPPTIIQHPQHGSCSLVSIHPHPGFHAAFATRSVPCC